MVSTSGKPRCAKIMVGSVVTSSSSITRGFVSSTYARTLRRRGSGDRSTTPGSAATRAADGDSREDDICFSR